MTCEQVLHVTFFGLLLTLHPFFPLADHLLRFPSDLMSNKSAAKAAGPHDGKKGIDVF